MPLEALFSQARREPGRLALVHNGEAWGYAAFARAIAGARSRLAEAEIRPGGLAVVAIDDLVQSWVALFASRSLGLTTIAVDSATDLAALGLRRMSVVIVLGDASPSEAEAFAGPAGCAIVRLPAARPADPAPGPAPAWPLPPGPPLAGHVLLTSGTTGAYKKVLREPGADLRWLGQATATYAIAPSSVAYVGNFPPWTAGGYRWPRIAWSVGAAVVFENSPEPHRPFGRLAMTHAFATPATLATLLAAPEAAIRRDDALRLVVTAGSLPRALADRARERITRAVHSSYASTEASTVTMTRIESDEDLLWHRPLAPGSLQVVDEAGRELPAGEVGLVRVRPAAGIDGYLDDEAMTREFFREGWFYPGDLGTLRADGRLGLQGRSTDVINLLGSKVATGPIERAFEDGLGVSGACVFSQPDGRGGEEVHVAVESRAPVERDRLAALARRTLAAFPQVHFHVVEELPRNAMGKVRRIDLRRRFARG